MGKYSSICLGLVIETYEIRSRVAGSTPALIPLSGLRCYFTVPSRAIEPMRATAGAPAPQGIAT